jgi:hypothetical protein
MPDKKLQKDSNQDEMGTMKDHLNRSLPGSCAAPALSSLRGLALLIAGITLFFAGCGNSGAVSPAVSIQAQYSSAVHDSRTVTSAKISMNLTPIVNDNKDLIWENGVAGSRVLVLSWIKSSDAKYYDGTVDPYCAVGSANCTLKADLWVTVAPEMKNFFRGATPQPLRITQLLGTPPEYSLEERSMVELWVSPGNMFRPCPDPEIADRECQAEFPADPFRTFSATELIRATEGPERGVFMNYTGWFNNRKNYIYSYARNYPTTEPYPWTRLGYTYDWGSPNHVGLSEFVVHGRKQDGSGIPVGIRTLKKTADYFLQ